MSVFFFPIIRLPPLNASTVELTGLDGGPTRGDHPHIQATGSTARWLRRHTAQRAHHLPLCPLPAETYVNETVKERVVVTWNMELDTLRSDLGAPPCRPPSLTARLPACSPLCLPGCPPARPPAI